MNYEELKKKHPELNWAEAEEVSPEELEAAAELFDRIAKQKRQEALYALSPKDFTDKRFKPSNKKGIPRTSFSGEIEASFPELVSLFGFPNEKGDDYKVSTEWILEDENGEVAKIYDYKATNLYSRSMPSVEEFRRKKLYSWHIAASTVATSNALFNIIKNKVNK